MKKILFSSLLALFAAVPSLAGVNNINYQAVIKDASGIVKEKSVEMKFELLDNTNNVVFTETKSATTDAAGLVVCQIGDNSLQTVDWSDLSLRVSIDLGSGYKVVSTEPVSSVPTAMYALRTADSDEMKTRIVNNTQNIDALQQTVEEKDNYLKTVVTELEDRSNALDSDLNNTKAYFDNNLTDLKAFVNNNKELIYDLENKSKEIMSDLTGLALKVDNNTNEIASLKNNGGGGVGSGSGISSEDIESINNSIHELKDKIEDLQTEMIRMRNVISSLQIHENELEYHIYSLQNDLLNIIQLNDLKTE